MTGSGLILTWLHFSVTLMRELNLSNNRIQDISPLFSLENLEFVDLSGNKISPASLRKLTEKGLNVVC